MVFPDPGDYAYLQARLCVCGQVGLSRARQEGLSWGEKGSGVGGTRLAEVKEPHGSWWLQCWPHGSLPGKHRLLALLAECRSRLCEGQGCGRGHRMAAAKESGRWGWWAALLQEEVTREPGFT